MLPLFCTKADRADDRSRAGSLSAAVVVATAAAAFAAGWLVREWLVGQAHKTHAAEQATGVIAVQPDLLTFLRFPLRVRQHLQELDKLNTMAVPDPESAVAAVKVPSPFNHQRVVVSLIFLGRDVEGLGKAGDLVWVVWNAKAILPEKPFERGQLNVPFESLATISNCYLVNARTGEVFSVFPDQRIEPVAPEKNGS